MTQTEITTVEDFDTQLNKMLRKATLTFSRKKKLLIVGDMALLTARAHRNKIIKDEEMDEWFSKIFSKYGFKKEDYMERVK